jgi:single-stranded DNA-binding protein
LVLVEGRLSVDSKTGGPRIWTGQDGTPRASLEVVAGTVKFLSPKTDGTGPGGVEEEVDNAPSEEIPF